MELPQVLQFGSRTGSYLALVFFCVVFMVLSVAIAGGRTRGARLGRPATWLRGLPIFGLLTTILYYSMLSGFYEAELLHDRLVLSYLLRTTVEVRLDEISSVRTTPVSKGMWRLHLTNAQGVDYASAASRREVVEAAALKLRFHFNQRRVHPNRRALNSASRLERIVN